jgi:hypothetical protein
LIPFPVSRRSVEHAAFLAFANRLGHVTASDWQALSDLAGRIIASDDSDRLLSHVAGVAGMDMTRRQLRRWLYRIAPLYVGEERNS